VQVRQVGDLLAARRHVISQLVHNFGVLAGGVLGWLAGIGMLAIPGIGPLIAAGPIVAALAGAGALGTFGGIVGALVGMGIPEYEAKRYEGRMKHGGILLSVHCDNSDWAKRGEEILKMTGAEDVSATSEAHADFGASDKPTLRTRSSILDEKSEEHLAERKAERDADLHAAVADLRDPDELRVAEERAAAAKKAELQRDEADSPRTRTAGGSSRLDG